MNGNSFLGVGCNDGPVAKPVKQLRADWLAWRRSKEAALAYGPASRLNVFFFRACTALLKGVIHAVGMRRFAYARALNVRLECRTVTILNLPDAFSGFTILHVSDLHFDIMPSLSWVLARRLAGLNVDLVALTGDFTDFPVLKHDQLVSHLRRMLRGVHAREGVFATLGNHDSCDIVEPLERAGIRFLINETISIQRAEQRIHITGLDDVRTFHTQEALDAMTNSGSGCKILLVHSPEVAAEAEAAGYTLYLTGHTHGGQICLPGGHPIVTGLNRHKELHHGFWRLGRMAGHTSSGAGVSNLPLRINRPGTVTLMTLNPTADPSATIAQK